MTFTVENKKAAAAYQPVKNSPLFKYNPGRRPLLCGPFFTPQDKNLTVHATVAGKAALTELQNGKQRVFYSLLPLDAQLLRGIAEYCGLHIWLNTEDSFGANENLVVVHAASAGVKTLTLPRKATVRDARTMEVIQKDCSKLQFKLDKFENRVFIVE